MIVIFRGFGDAGSGFQAKVWSNINDEETVSLLHLPIPFNNFPQ